MLKVEVMTALSRSADYAVKQYILEVESKLRKTSMLSLRRGILRLAETRNNFLFSSSRFWWKTTRDSAIRNK